MYNILCGDNKNLLRQLDENSIDVCITDPPYQMGMAEWDYYLPDAETWSEVLRVLKPGAWCLSFCSPELYHRMATKMEDGGFVIRDMVMWIITTKMAKTNKLKPAHEPVAIAQKPISESTIKANIERWGTGTITIDGNRVPWDKKVPKNWTGGQNRRAFGKHTESTSEQPTEQRVEGNPDGRYPSNVVGLFDEVSHQKYFYAPRVSRKERGEYNTHPTPKPIDLMRWLINVYTPKGNSTVLDPFCGSGSTGIASVISDLHFIGMDLSSEYCEIAKRRISEHDDSHFANVDDLSRIHPNLFD